MENGWRECEEREIGKGREMVEGDGEEGDGEVE